MNKKETNSLFIGFIVNKSGSFLELLLANLGERVNGKSVLNDFFFFSWFIILCLDGKNDYCIQGNVSKFAVLSGSKNAWRNEKDC